MEEGLVLKMSYALHSKKIFDNLLFGEKHAHGKRTPHKKKYLLIQHYLA